MKFFKVVNSNDRLFYSGVQAVENQFKLIFERRIFAKDALQEIQRKSNYCSVYEEPIIDAGYPKSNKVLVFLKEGGLESAIGILLNSKRFKKEPW